MAKASKSGAKKDRKAIAVEAAKPAVPYEWNPALPDAAAPAMQEINEPRPSTGRYPIPDARVASLQVEATSVRLRRGKAQRAEDRGDAKPELSALAGPPAAPSVAVASAAAPTGSKNFHGIAATQWIPPDCTMAVGPEHVLVSVNSSVAIFDKNGNVALPQRTLTQWFSSLGPLVEGMTVFDPKALYDQHDQRWVLLAVAVQNATKKSLHLLSISASSDPLGSWRTYALDATVDGNVKTNNWADFPGLGVDSHALYVTSNMFQFGGNFQYAKVRVIPKAGPYAGNPATFFDFTKLKNADGTFAFAIQPCHTFGAPQVEYLANSAFPNGNFLMLWAVQTSGGVPSISGRRVPVSPYSLPPLADQGGGKPPLNTEDVRLLHAVLRGDSVWTAWTVAHNWGSAANTASVQWCQIRAATASIVQQGVYGAANVHYFFPACCPDNNGNMIMVFSRSGATSFGSTLYTGRRSTDPLGMLQPSAVLKAGVAGYFRPDTGGRNRWGDYSGVAADPANSRAVWFYGEYASALDTWDSWVGSAFF